MYLECTCCNISEQKWDYLMKDAKRMNKRVLTKLVKNNMRYVYDALSLNLYNPYNYYKTATHYILVHSAIEYFIRREND